MRVKKAGRLKVNGAGLFKIRNGGGGGWGEVSAENAGSDGGACGIMLGEGAAAGAGRGPGRNVGK